MPILVERKLFKIGEGGFAVTLPKAWINYHRLKPGDTVEVVVDGEHHYPGQSEAGREAYIRVYRLERPVEACRLLISPTSLPVKVGS